MKQTEARFLSMQHFVNGYPRMDRFPELTSAIDRVAREPFDLMRTYGRYRSFLNHLVYPTQTDMEMLEAIHQKYPNHQGALHFMEKFGPGRLTGEDGSPGLKVVLDQAVSPFASSYPKAFEDLTRMMGNAQAITENPHDRPGTEDMIYGYRVIRDNPQDPRHHANYTEAQMHFVLLHFLERALFAAVPPSAPGAKWEKDDFLGALGDIIMISDEQRRQLGEPHKHLPELVIWTRGKDDGGLGWIDMKYLYVTFDYWHKRLTEGVRP